MYVYLVDVDIRGNKDHTYYSAMVHLTNMENTKEIDNLQVLILSWYVLLDAISRLAVQHNQ
jgi:hypothetical protein